LAVVRIDAGIPGVNTQAGVIGAHVPSSIEERVEEALREVIDPEVGVNVVDLGLVYSVNLEGGAVRVVMTMTTPACPLGPYLHQAAEAAVRRGAPEVESITIELVWDPPWTPERMSLAARRQLGWPEA